METCATENDGQYTDCDVTELEAIEPTLPPQTAAEPTDDLSMDISGQGASAYTITIRSTTGNTFSVVNAGGTMTYPCVATGENRGGCPESEVWD